MSVTALLLGASPALADETVGVWRLTEFNDPGNRGAMTATLTYGDRIGGPYRFTATCDARPSTSVVFSSVTVMADAGNLEDGSEVDLRFIAPGFDQGVSAFVYNPDPGGSPASLSFEPEHGDTVWTVLASADTVQFGVPGHPASTLDPRHGKDVTRSFVAACRNYQDVVMPEQATGPAGPVAVAGPSFSCLTSLNAAEQRLCANSVLADRDRELAGLFEWVGLDLQGGDRTRHEDDQARWMATRDACGADDQCLAAAYDARLNELNR